MTPSPTAERWTVAAAALSAVSGLLFVAAPEQLGGLVALCAQSAAQLMVIPAGFEQQVLLTAFFFLASAWQWLLAVLLVAYRARLGRALLATGVVWTGAIVGTWVIAKLWGLAAGSAEAVGGVDAVAQLIQWATLGCLAASGPGEPSPAQPQT